MMHATLGKILARSWQDLDKRSMWKCLPRSWQDLIKIVLAVLLWKKQTPFVKLSHDFPIFFGAATTILTVIIFENRNK